MKKALPWIERAFIVSPYIMYHSAFCTNFLGAGAIVNVTMNIYKFIMTDFS